MRIELTTFHVSEDAIRSIRDAVFGREQGVPREIDWDGHDGDCIHAVAVEADGSVVGTGRLLPDGRIGRLAVLRADRGQGTGAMLLDALVSVAREKGMTQVHLHAQVDAVPFYRKSGFLENGDTFLEAGIRHVTMTRDLSQ